MCVPGVVLAGRLTARSRPADTADGIPGKWDASQFRCASVCVTWCMCVHACLFASVRVFVCASLGVCMYARLFASTCVCTSVCVHACLAKLIIQMRCPFAVQTGRQVLCCGKVRSQSPAHFLFHHSAQSGCLPSFPFTSAMLMWPLSVLLYSSSHVLDCISSTKKTGSLC